MNRMTVFVMSLMSVLGGPAAFGGSDKTETKEAAPVAGQAHDAEKAEAKREPARAEGDLSPEAGEMLRDAGTQVERMLDRSLRSY